MIGRKLYYDNRNGDVVLHIPEKHHESAKDTTKEQDFEMYSVLQARNKDSINVIKLDYGEKRGDFQKAKSIHVNVDTDEIEFEFPNFEKPHTPRIEHLEQFENLSKDEQTLLGQSLTDAELENMRQGQKQSDLELRVLELEAK